MTQLLEWLGRWCARHGWIVLLLWSNMLILTVSGAVLTGTQTTDDFAVPGAGSARAVELLQSRFPDRAGVDASLVLISDDGPLTRPELNAAVQQTAARLRELPDVIGLPQQGAAVTALSPDGRTALISFLLNKPLGEVVPEDLDRILAAAEPARAAGLQAEVGGGVAQAASMPETGAAELVGLGAAVLILLIAFGSVIAMALPVVMAIVGLGIGLALLTMAGHLVQLPSTASSLATMIGLGVGIDYALFVVTRHRTQLANGMSTLASIGRANATSGEAVVFAGITVIIAICGLAVAGIPIVTAHGYTTSVVVALAVLAAITLLPALLGLLGPNVNRLRLPRLTSRRQANPAKASDAWAAWSARIARHPWGWALSSLLLIAALAAPALTLQLGQPDSGSAAEDTTERRAYDALASAFGPGINGPLLLAVDLDGATSPPADAETSQGQQRPTDTALADLRTALSAVDGVASVSPPTIGPDGRAAVLNVIPTTAPQDRRTEQLVQRLRDDVLPAHTPPGARVYVGGQSATFIDLAARTTDRLPWFIGGVVLLSCLLLGAVFRSVVIPLQAAVMNILSIGAALGVIVLVFQHGIGLQLVGLDEPLPIISFVPLMMFAILFGLSMDYQVFLLSSVREGWLETGDNRQAVQLGLSRSGRVITSAAMIMVAVFGSFALSDDPLLKIFGVGLTAAIALDATVIRSVLAPAVMILCDRANWWLPGRTHHLQGPIAAPSPRPDGSR
jgi:putative drug exporter of the RND superfamily